MAGLESSASEEQITINVPNALETIQQILSTSKEEFKKAFQGTVTEEVEGLAGDTEVIPQGEDVSGDIATGTADMARDATESLDVDSLLEPEKNETPITDNNAGIDSIPSAEVGGTGETVAAGDSAGVGTAGAVEAGASTESMGTTQGGTTGTGGTSAPSGDSASMGGSSSEGVSVETGGETGASGEAGNASGSVLTNDEFIEKFFELSDTEKIDYIGSLSQTEYEKLLAKVEAQYRQNISDYDAAINDTNEQLLDLKILLSWVSDKYESYERYYQSVLDEVNGCFYDSSRHYELKKYGITEEDIEQGLEHVLEKAFSSELVQTNLNSLEEQLNEQLQIEIDGNQTYQIYSGMTYAQLLAIKQELENGLALLKALRLGDKKNLSTAQYDLLVYTTEYQEFLQRDTSINPDDVEGQEQIIGYPDSKTYTVYSYTDYKAEHQDANPIDFYLAVKKKGTENNIIIGIGNIDKIEELIAISEYQHSVAEGTDTSRVPLTDTNIDYLTIYIYKYYQNPSEAEQLLEDIDQVFKYYEGALEANKQIEQLGELIDSDKIRGLYDQISTLDVNDPEQVQLILDQIEDLDIKDKQTVLDLIKSLDLDDKENLQQKLYHILDVASGLQKIKETLAADLNVSIDGLGDGIYDFFEGFAKLFWDGELSAQDYKVMIYLSYLQQHSYFLDNIYKTTTSIGNMLPTVTLAVILNAACPGLAATQVSFLGGTVTSNITLALMSLSSFGTTQNQLKFQGYADWQAISYAILSSGSVFLFQRFGGILGLQNTPGSSFLENWFREGGQQVARQTLIQLLGNGLILGEEIDITNMTQEAFETFLSSLVISGALNLYTKGLTIVVNGIRYQITGADAEAIAKYLDTLDNKMSFSWRDLEAILEFRNNNNLSFDEALLILNTLKDDQNTSLYDTAILATERISKIQDNTGFDFKKSAALEVVRVEFNRCQDLIQEELAKTNPDMELIRILQTRKNDLNHQYHLEEYFELVSSAKGAPKEFAGVIGKSTPKIESYIHTFRSSPRTMHTVTVGGVNYQTDLTEDELVKFANDYWSDIHIDKFADYPVGRGVPASSDFIRISKTDGKMTIVWGENDGALYGTGKSNSSLQAGSVITRVGYINGINVCAYSDTESVPTTNTSSTRGLPWAEGSATANTWKVIRDINVPDVIRELQNLELTNKPLYDEILSDVAWDLYHDPTRTITMNDIQCLTGKVAPDFGGAGMDTQFTLPIRTLHLENLGFIERI